MQLGVLGSPGCGDRGTSFHGLCHTEPPGWAWPSLLFSREFLALVEKGQSLSDLVPRATCWPPSQSRWDGAEHWAAAGSQAWPLGYSSWRKLHLSLTSCCGSRPQGRTPGSSQAATSQAPVSGSCRVERRWGLRRLPPTRASRKGRSSTLEGGACAGRGPADAATTLLPAAPSPTCC